MATDQSMHIAAQAWCQPETSHIEMDVRLAKAFAEVLDKETASLRAKLRVYEDRLELRIDSIDGIPTGLGEDEIDRLRAKLAEAERKRDAYRNGMHIEEKSKFEALQELDEVRAKLAECERDAEIGRRWNRDSSLEAWFPYTAEELTRMRAELSSVTAERDAIRELMNCYNLGGWTDALAPMQRALTAEARADRLEAVMRRAVVFAWMRSTGKGPQAEDVDDIIKRAREGT